MCTIDRRGGPLLSMGGWEVGGRSYMWLAGIVFKHTTVIWEIETTYYKLVLILANL